MRKKEGDGREMRKKEGRRWKKRNEEGRGKNLGEGFGV